MQLTNISINSLGKPIVILDADIEQRLRRKIDFYILPTVALLYLFCFIDRANIGENTLIETKLTPSAFRMVAQVN